MLTHVCGVTEKTNVDCLSSLTHQLLRRLVMFLPFLAMREVARLYANPSSVLHAQEEETMENFLFVCSQSCRTEETNAKLADSNLADAA